jgi:hypothetical protein
MRSSLITSEEKPWVPPVSESTARDFERTTRTCVLWSIGVWWRFRVMKTSLFGRLIVVMSMLLVACASKPANSGGVGGAPGGVGFGGVTGAIVGIGAGGTGPANQGASGATSISMSFGAAGKGAGGAAPLLGSGGTPASAGKGGAGVGGAAGMVAGVAGMNVSGAGAGGSSGPGPGMAPGGPVSDYAAPGPFMTTTMDGTGPDGMYTIYRPMTLGENGFKHPIATWGNGITTTPQLYPGLLGGIASHGFVIVASDSTGVTADLMTAGLDWLIKQNDAGGMFEGKLDVKRAASIGYSLGGGAAVTTGKHPNVIVTVSMHGLPGDAGSLHGPLLLFTSTQDTFVTADGFVTPNYVASKVQTFYAWLAGAGDNGHLTPIGDAGPERAPMIAWLRLWVYGDDGAKKYFYGDDCILCKDPWSAPQDSMKSPMRKNWM